MSRGRFTGVFGGIAGCVVAALVLPLLIAWSGFNSTPLSFLIGLLGGSAFTFLGIVLGNRYIP